jgi:uncharacterized membrane protein
MTSPTTVGLTLGLSGSGEELEKRRRSLIGLIFLNPLFDFAVGAGAGAVKGALSDVGIDDDFMREFAEGLTRGSSALFVLVRKSTPDKVLEKLKGTGGKILTTSLKHEDAAKLQAAISAPKA